MQGSPVDQDQSPAQQPAAPQTTTLSPSFSQWLEVWKLAHAVAVEAALVAGGLILFVYLVQIGHPELLLQAVSSPSGLLVIVLWTVIFSVCLFVMFFGSLWFVDIAATTYRQPGHIPKAMRWLLIVFSTLWYALVVLVFMYRCLNEHLNLVVGCFMGVLVFCTTLLQLFKDPIRIAGHRPRFKAAGTGAITGCLFGMAMLLSLLAPLAFLAVDPAFGQQPDNFWPVVLLVGTSIPELIFGCALFWRIAKGESAATVRKRTVIAVLAIAVVLLLGGFRYLDTQVLRTLGVYSTTPSPFLVTSPDIAADFKSVGFSVTTSKDGADVLHAIVKFRFGEVLLLCKPPKRRAASPSHGKQPTSKGATKKLAQGQCLQVHPDDVRPYYPIKEPSSSAAPKAG